MELEFLFDLAAGEHLDRVLALGQPLLPQALGSDFGTAVEALLEVGEVDRLGLGAEVLERHRLLFVRAAQLSHPHVDRVLAALVAGLALGAGARARALMAAARGLAARALAAADPLAGLFRARLRLQVVEADLLGALALGGGHQSLTSTGCETPRSWPCSCGESSRSTDLPIRPSPSARRVAFCFGSVPLVDFTWEILTALTRRSPRRGERWAPGRPAARSSPRRSRPRRRCPPARRAPARPTA